MSYYMVDLHVYSWIFNQFAFSRTRWGTILKCSVNFWTPFLRFVYIASIRTPLLTSYLHWCWAAAPEHQRKSASWKWITITRNTNHFLIFLFLIQLLDQEIYSTSIIKIQHGIQHFNRFCGFWCVICRTNLQWAQSTTELSKYPELDKTIEESHSRDALSFFDCILRTPNLNYQW